MGWSVIPIGDRKVPLIKWKEFQTRLPTEDEVTKWFGPRTKANIGIVTGMVSGLIVLDVDSEQGQAFVDSKGGFTNPTVITGKKGHHYYCIHPGDREYRNFAGVEDGIDARGDGGYVVAPPSIHPETKKMYEWHTHRTVYQPPDWFLDLFVEKEKPQRDPDWHLRALGEPAPPGQRNDMAFRLASKYVGQGKTVEEVRAMILGWNLNNPEPLTDTEIFKLVQSAFDTHERNHALPEGDRQEVFRDISERLTLPILGIDKYVKEDPSYDLWVQGRAEPIRLTKVDQLINYTTFKKMVFAAVDHSLPPIGKEEWSKILNRLVRVMNQIEIGEEGFDRGQTAMWLDSYLAQDVFDEQGWLDAVKAGTPFKKDGRLHFNFTSFKQFVQKDLGNRVSDPELATRLTQIGADRVRIRVPTGTGGSVQQRFYVAPGLRAVEDTA